MKEIIIRFATADDAHTICALIKGLAEYEREPDAVEATPESISTLDMTRARIISELPTSEWAMSRKTELFYHNPTTPKADMSVSRGPISAFINCPADLRGIPFGTLMKFHVRMIPNTGETIVKAILTGFILTILSTSDACADSQA